MFVLVTAPHAFSSTQTSLRTSDVVAKLGADAMTRALQARGLQVRLLVSDIDRARCDLNRYTVCDSNRNFKRAYEQALRERPLFVIDVHSYPASERWALASPTNAVILYEPIFADVARRFADAIRAQGLASAALQGSPGVNFIISEAARTRVPSVLLELNEDDSHTNRMRVIEASATVIATLATSRSSTNHCLIMSVRGVQALSDAIVRVYDKSSIVKTDVLRAPNNDVLTILNRGHGFCIRTAAGTEVYMSMPLSSHEFDAAMQYEPFLAEMRLRLATLRGTLRNSIDVHRSAAAMTFYQSK